MNGARAQFGRRPAVPASAHRPLPPAEAQQVAGRGAARTRVLAGSRQSRRSVAFPALALAVVTLTWVDAGVLRAEDAVAEPPAPSAANDGDMVALPPWRGETGPATEVDAAVSGGVAVPDANERDENDEEDEA